MAKSVTIVITGDRELNKALQALSKTEARKVMRQASRNALKPLLPKVKAETPVRTGKLRRSLTVRAIKKSRTRVGAMITTRTGNYKGETFYGGFMEWGWKRGKRGTPNRKKIPGRRMMKRAADRNRQSVLAHYRQLAHKGIVETIKQRTATRTNHVA